MKSVLFGILLIASGSAAIATPKSSFSEQTCGFVKYFRVGSPEFSGHGYIEALNGKSYFFSGESVIGVDFEIEEGQPVKFIVESHRIRNTVTDKTMKQAIQVEPVESCQ